VIGVPGLGGLLTVAVAIPVIEFVETESTVATVPSSEAKLIVKPFMDRPN